MFNVGMFGHNFDPKSAEDPERFKAFFYEHTGRTDLKLNNIKWLSYFKFVSFSHYEYNNVAK
jgi:hypothetical protein